MDKLIFHLSLIALLLSSFCHGAVGKTVIVSLPGRELGRWKGAVADFGYQFDQLTSHPANLILAPETDPFLCSYPASLDKSMSQVDKAAAPRNEVPVHVTAPIALLISRGQCSLEEKVEVSLALQKNYTRGLQYVIIYNNDHHNPNQHTFMTPVDDLDLPNLGFVTVSAQTGSYLVDDILHYAKVNQQEPYLGANDTEWEYPIVIECLNKVSGVQYMIGIAICSAFLLAFRTIYLLQTGEVRIEFRRNERGCITGLRVIRTIPSRVPNHLSTMTQLLTVEQVRDLPEIVYTKKDSESVEDISLDSCEVTVESQESHQAEVESTIHVRIMDGGHDEETGQIGPDDENLGSYPVFALPENITTSSSCCSICIEDFQDGERIRMLPRCKHAFHTNCVMPWLTQHQSCCPVCKRSVLESEEVQVDGPIDEEDCGEERDAEQGQARADERQEISLA